MILENLSYLKELVKYVSALLKLNINLEQKSLTCKDVLEM